MLQLIQDGQLAIQRRDGAAETNGDRQCDGGDKIATPSVSRGALSRGIHDHDNPASLQWLWLEVLRQSIRQPNPHLRHLQRRTLDERDKPTGSETLPRRPTLVLQPDIL